MDPREQAESDRLNAEFVLGGVMQRYPQAKTPEGLRDHLRGKLAPVGWANAQQRAKARGEYAAESDDPEEILNRWNQSRLLVDPHTQKAQEQYLRDFRLLDGLTRKDDPAKVVEDYEGPLDTRLAPEMLNYNGKFDNGDGSLDILNTKLMASLPGSILQNLQDPESGAGWYMGRANLGPSMGKYAGGGEADSFSDAIGMAAGDLGFKEMHRIASRTPVMGLPDDATPEQIAARKGELMRQAALVEAPQYQERWKRVNGYDPGPVVGFLSDLGYDFLDPSLLVDVAAGPTKALLNPTARAYMAAQGGLLRNLAKETAGELGAEAAVEVPFAVGVNAVAGGGVQAYGDHDVKTPDELAEAKQLRHQYEVQHANGWQDPDDAIYNERVEPAMREAYRRKYGPSPWEVPQGPFGSSR